MNRFIRLDLSVRLSVDQDRLAVDRDSRNRDNLHLFTFKLFCAADITGHSEQTAPESPD